MRVGHLLVALALAGCAETSRDVAAPVAPPPSPSAAAPSPAAAAPTPSPLPETASCENPEGGYALEHPSEWSVGGGEGIEPCTFFDPGPLALEPGTEASGVAIRTDVRDVPLDQARRDAGGEQQDLRANGLPAVRTTGTYGDEALLPVGTRFTTWLIALGDRTLLITADTASDDDEQAVEVLDEMVQTVRAL